jgi:hypothetical protein
MSGPGATTRQGKIPIALLALRAGDEQLLTMVIERFLGAELDVVPADRARAAVIDGDSTMGEAAIAGWLERNPQAPTLVLSLHSASDARPLTYLRKPIDIEALIDALKRMCATLNPHRRSGPSLAARSAARGQDVSKPERTARAVATAIAEPKPNPRSSLVPSPAPATRADTATQQVAGQALSASPVAIQQLVLAEQSANLEGRDYCGIAEDLPVQVLREAAAFGLRPDIAVQLYFDPDVRLLGLLLRAGTLARANHHAVLIKGLQGALLVLPGSPLKVFSTIDGTVLRALCSTSMFSEVLEVSSPLPVPDARYSFDYEALLWKVALWSSRGRLPRGTDPNAPVSLRRMPDFPRLTPTPYAEIICRLWAGPPASLIDTIAHLGIPQRYVFAVYSGARMLNLIHDDVAALS